MQLFDVYPLLDLEPVKGEGSYIFTADGTRYLDFYGGHAVISIGHSHPHYIERVSGQLSKLGFYSNSVQNPLQQELARKLGKLSGYSDYRLFLCNSGAEAVENALKVASFHTGKPKVISMKKSFHGRTSAAVCATDKPRYRAPVNGEGAAFLEWNDLEGLKQELSAGDACAFIIEGIQGIGGIHIPDAEFLQQAAQLCSDYGVVFICDEIQSGYGRSGKFFAHQHAGVTPDIITVAKGMGNGFPIAGSLFSPQFEAEYGMLGSTFGGNHLACAAGLAVLEVMQEEQLISHAADAGAELKARLNNLTKASEVRGQGLIIGIEFPFPIKKLRQRLIEEEQILTGVASDPNVLRLLPPLNITSSQINIFMQAIKKVLKNITIQ